MPEPSIPNRVIFCPFGRRSAACHCFGRQLVSRSKSQHLDHLLASHMPAPFSHYDLPQICHQRKILMENAEHFSAPGGL